MRASWYQQKEIYELTLIEQNLNTCLIASKDQNTSQQLAYKSQKIKTKPKTYLTTTVFVRTERIRNEFQKCFFLLFTEKGRVLE